MKNFFCRLLQHFLASITLYAYIFSMEPAPGAQIVPPPGGQTLEVIELNNGLSSQLVPRHILLQSPFWHAQFQENPHTVSLPPHLNLDHVARLLNTFYARRNLRREALLAAAYYNTMTRIEREYCSTQIASLHGVAYAPNIPYHEDTPYGKYLVSFLSQLNATQHTSLIQTVAYALSHREWKMYNYHMEGIYRQLVRENSPESAAEFARYAFLLKGAQLRETNGAINTAEPSSWSYFCNYFSLETDLTIPRGSCKFSFDEYLGHKTQLLTAHTTNNTCEFSSLMLDNVDDLPNWIPCRQLPTLDLSHNYLSSISPQVLGLLIHLRSLNCSHNRLEILPALSALTQLQYLNVSHNQLTTLEGAGLAQLTSLRQLDVSSNQLPAAPEWATRLNSVNFENNRQ